MLYNNDGCLGQKESNQNVNHLIVCVCVFLSMLPSENQNTNFIDWVKTFLGREGIKAAPHSNFKGPFER